MDRWLLDRKHRVLWAETEVGIMEQRIGHKHWSIFLDARPFLEAHYEAAWKFGHSRLERTVGMTQIKNRSQVTPDGLYVESHWRALDDRPAFFYCTSCDGWYHELLPPLGAKLPRCPKCDNRGQLYAALTDRLRPLGAARSRRDHTP